MTEARRTAHSNPSFPSTQPQDPLRISLNDLIRCGCGETVVEMLIDINGFWVYDNRENVMYDDDDEDEEDTQ